MTEGLLEKAEPRTMFVVFPLKTTPPSACSADTSPYTGEASERSVYNINDHLSFYPHRADSMGMICFLRLMIPGRKAVFSLGETINACCTVSSSPR